MTYIERAISDFTREVMVSGIRTLFTPKYLPFTFIGILIVVINSFIIFLGQISSTLATENVISFLLAAEISVGIAFFLAGIFFGRFHIILQVSFITLIIVTLTFLLYSNVVSLTIIQYVTGFLFVFWIILGSISQFTFFRDFLGNRITGGILFLGKPSDDGKILFRGVVAVLTVFNIISGVTILFIANNNPTEIFIAILIIIAGCSNLIPLFHLQKKGDVFFTILTWFYVIGSLRVIYVTFLLVSDTFTDQVSLLDLVLTFFLVIFAVHKAAKVENEVEEKDLDTEEQHSEKISFKIHKVTMFFRPEGIFLMILGSVIGYHAATIQFRLDQFQLLNDFMIIQNTQWSLISHITTIVTYLILYILFITLYFFYPTYRKYANPKIMRLNWLPAYEDMRNVVVSIAKGKINIKVEAFKIGTKLMKGEIKKKLGFKKEYEMEDRVESIINQLVESVKETQMKDNK